MKSLKKYIVKILLGKNIFLSKYFLKSKNDIYKFFSEKLNFISKSKKSVVFNLIITSNAEVRIFEPLINYFLKDEKHKVFIVYVSNYYFNEDLTNKINSSKNIKITTTPASLISSFKSRNFVNVICLDHTLYQKQHQIGINLINYLNLKKAKTVCIQHGGCQSDNIKGQITSASKYQIIFGEIIYNEVLSSGIKKSNVYLTGNPNHDRLNNINSEKLNGYINSGNKKIILLATCLHTEYDYREDSEICYVDYITNVYDSIDFSKYFLIIKMHPNDAVNPSLYEVVMNDLNLNVDNIQIITPTVNTFSVYDYIDLSDLVISRSSTVIEESLLFGKNTIGYDLFDDGPSSYYSYLERYELYERVVESKNDLKSSIEHYINKKTNTAKHKADMIKNFTYKLDGLSLLRVINALEDISKK